MNSRIAQVFAPVRNQRGVALPLALIALVGVSVLVTGVMLQSSTEVAASSVHQDATRALYIAESGLEAYVAQRSATFDADAEEGNFFPFTPTGASAEDEVNIRVIQVAEIDNRTTYSIRSEPATAGKRTVTAMVTRVAPAIDININEAASVSADKITIPGNSAQIVGTDTSSCSTGDVKGLTIAEGVEVDLRESTVEGGIDSTNISKADFAEYVLGMEPREMAKFADIRWGELGPSALPYSGFGIPSGDNPRESGLNWGCPVGASGEGFRAACQNDVDKDYFPFVAIDPPAGETVELEGEGQGALIVLGDAHGNAGFAYKGIVIVTGNLQLNGGSRIYGSLVALGTVTLDDTVQDDDDEVLLNGQNLIQFNRCTLNEAIQAMNDAATGQALPNQTFAWTELVRK